MANMEVQADAIKPQNIVSGHAPDLSTLSAIEMLSQQQLQYVDYCVVQGLITADDGKATKMSLAEFAMNIGVDPSTLFRWKKGIPRFWDFVAQRRKVIFTQTRTQKVWNSLYLAATSKMDVRAMQTWLTNADPEFVMPNMSVKHEAGDSLSELLLAVRSRKQNQIMEGEIVAEPTNPDH